MRSLIARLGRGRNAALVLLCSLSLVGATAVGTLALFTASAPLQNSNLAAGTVSLGAPVHTLVDVSGLAPGDGGSSSFSVTYTGSLPAWVGLLPVVTGNLYTCAGGQFNLSLTDADTNPYVWNLIDPQVIRTDAQAVPVAPNTTKTFQVNWGLAPAAPNACQGKAASIGLQVVAVQADHNANGANTGPAIWNFAGTPDAAYHPIPSIYLWFDRPEIVWGQAFTPTRTGAIDRIAVNLWKLADETGDVTVRFWEIDNLVPTGDPLGETVVPGPAIPLGTFASNSNTSFEIPLSKPILVKQGKLYAFTFHLTGKNLAIAAVNPENYPAGHVVFVNSSGNWDAIGYGMVFTTFVR